MSKIILHLIANAHLDPVWMWDKREGDAAALNTAKSVLSLMREFPQLTFVRGESYFYEVVEKYAPELFWEISQRIREGRWEVTGGTLVQMDDNMTPDDIMLEEFSLGKRYFREKFGVEAECYWSADAFGHSRHLPEILSAAGIRYFAFSRPCEEILPLGRSAFFWKAESGTRILCFRAFHGNYNCERTGVTERIASAIADCRREGLQNAALFIGMGDHGGGPSRGMIEEVLRAQIQFAGEAEIRFSTFHTFFQALEKDVAAGADFPEIQKELNFPLRGVYAATGRLKKAYWNACEQMKRAGYFVSLARLAGFDVPDLAKERRTVAFNSFHDILPGTLIERAAEQQIEELHGAAASARDCESEALRRLSTRFDTRRLAPEMQGDFPAKNVFLLCNRGQLPFCGMAEKEVSLDFRPIFAYTDRCDEVPCELHDGEGKPVPFQLIPTEHSAVRRFPWRKRFLFPVELAPGECRIYECGYRENPDLAPCAGKAVSAPGKIGNDRIGVSVQEHSLELRFDERRYALRLLSVRDDFGAWGDMAEQPETCLLDHDLMPWRITRIEPVLSGPLRCSMMVFFQSDDGSHAELEFLADDGAFSVEIRARVLWNGRCRRMKLEITPGGGSMTARVPGGVAERSCFGETPALGSVTLASGLGIAGDCFGSVSQTAEACFVTLERATRYSDDEVIGCKEELFRPVNEQGLMKFRLLIAGDAPDPAVLASRFRTMTPVHTDCIPLENGSPLPRRTVLFELGAPELEIIGFYPQEAPEAGCIIRLWNPSAKTVSFTPVILGKARGTASIAPHAIASYRIGSGITPYKI